MENNHMTSYFKQITNLPVFDDLMDYINSIEPLWKNNDQICLNSPPEHISDYEYGVGTMVVDWSKFQPCDNTIEEKIKYLNKTQNAIESTFTEFNPLFRNTPLEKIYNEIKLNYNIGRVRLMRLSPRKTMSWHMDTTLRLHYPIKTNIGCRMAIKDECRHLPVNTWWITDTKNHHTAFNASDDIRIHLVACILE
jgi:hypothetical protein